MKHRFFKRISFALPALMLAMTGCLADNSETDFTPGNGVRTATFRVNVPGMKTPSTRALDATKEKEVNEINVLIFTNTDNTLVEHYRIDSSEIEDAVGANDYQFKVADVQNTSNVTVAFIANASVEVADALEAVTSGGTYIGAPKAGFLVALQANASAKWNTGASDYWTIPMYGELIATGTLYDAVTLPTVSLTRMLAKVDVMNGVAPANPASPADGTFSLTAVHVVNYNTAGVIAPAWNESTGVLLTAEPTSANLPTGFDPAMKAWADGNEQTYTLASGATSLTDEIYVFESNALNTADGVPPATPDGLRLILEGDYTVDGVTEHYYYPADFTYPHDGSVAEYMPVLRNNRYQFTITAANGRGYGTMGEAVAAFGVMSNLRTSLVVVDESGIKNIVWNGEYFLGTGDPIILDYPMGSTDAVAVSTNYAKGWQIDTSKGTNGIEYISGSDWLTAVKDGSDSDLQASILLSVNSVGSSVREAYVHFIAGRLTHKVKVTQRLYAPAASQTYVGAFWRANQTGERLIKITDVTYGGKWTVKVLDYGDFSADDIVFSTADSDDGNIYTASPADMNTYDATYRVNSNLTSVSETVSAGGTIFFRIGLRSNWSDNAAYNSTTKPCRYAVVALYHGDSQCVQHIYLRQGHEADYVMHPDDGDAGGIISDRGTYARKYRPYNLTASGLTNSSPYSVQLGVNGGTDTPYPSQGGALFQWSCTTASYQRRAYHPTTSGANLTWYVTPASSWNASTYETCPTGYRRPQGASDASVNEFVISLLFDLTEEIANSLWGYYADGYFDRRSIVSSANSIINSAVSHNTKDAAYVGRLFFNPVDGERKNASLFFPAAGGRSNTSATLGSTGTAGYYWASTIATSPLAYAIAIDADRFYIGNNNRSRGQSVRCVAE